MNEDLPSTRRPVPNFGCRPAVRPALSVFFCLATATSSSTFNFQVPVLAIGGPGGAVRLSFLRRVSSSDMQGLCQIVCQKSIITCKASWVEQVGLADSEFSAVGFNRAGGMVNKVCFNHLVAVLPSCCIFSFHLFRALFLRRCFPFSRAAELDQELGSSSGFWRSLGAKYEWGSPWVLGHSYLVWELQKVDQRI